MNLPIITENGLLGFILGYIMHPTRGLNKKEKTISRNDVYMGFEVDK